MPGTLMARKRQLMIGLTFRQPVLKALDQYVAHRVANNPTNTNVTRQQVIIEFVKEGLAHVGFPILEERDNGHEPD